MKYIPVIGLEVHVELKTKSKMFCGCAAQYFGEQPNTHTCPVCLGLPGALPVPNKKAIEWCVMIGMALNCEIPLFSKFDRKHYFYPDLAKGYQISQYDQPFAINGQVIIDKNKKIGIRRAHMEEDTGKLLHQNLGSEDVSLIDFNRSGVPLVEIVTEPEFDSAVDVKKYLQKLQRIVRYLNVSDANMEKGEMRLEPNISLKKPGERGLPKYKVEVKNINSFSFVEKAIHYEIERQTEILDAGSLPQQETRGYDELRNATLSQRTKEDAMDYRYFPEPDIPPIRWTNDEMLKIRNKMPELPDNKLTRFMENYKLSASNAELLTREYTIADFFEEAVKIGWGHEIEPKTIANYIINRKIDTASLLPAALIETIVKDRKIDSVSDSNVDEVVKKIITANGKAVLDYKGGKENALMFLLGQAMKELKGKANAETIKKRLLQGLK